MHSSWTITEIEDGNAVATVKGVSREDAVAAIYRAMRGEGVLPPAAETEPVSLRAEQRTEVAAAA
jgi:hypothetical protein